MPTERFLNLPEEKRRRIVNAALGELSRVPFDEMSINRIVHAAGIARGSYYQYFTDKCDLLGCVMQEYGQGAVDAANASLAASGGDLFGMFTDVLRHTVAFGTRPENLAFCRNVFAGLRPAGLERFHFSAESMLEAMRRYAPGVDPGLLADPSEAGLTLLLDTITTLLREAVAEAFADAARADEVVARFARQMELVKHGALRGGPSVYGPSGGLQSKHREPAPAEREAQPKREALARGGPSVYGPSGGLQSKHREPAPAERKAKPKREALARGGDA